QSAAGKYRNGDSSYQEAHSKAQQDAITLLESLDDYTNKVGFMPMNTTSATKKIKPEKMSPPSRSKSSIVMVRSVSANSGMGLRMHVHEFSMIDAVDGAAHAETASLKSSRRASIVSVKEIDDLLNTSVLLEKPSHSASAAIFGEFLQKIFN
ncbi:hypothetical protein HDU76_002524, partial [Blyttiomyces sp. JEL0837]